MSLQQARKHLSGDKILKRVIDTTEILKLPKTDNVFNELVKAIVYQQISFKAANSIYAKFTSYMGRENYLPGDILSLDHETLRGLGLSNQKAGYVKNIANFFRDRDLMQARWDDMPDAEVLDLLTQIKGVGEWTAQMILIFDLEREDIFPARDLGIQIAMKDLYQLKAEKSALIREMTQLAIPWQPYRSYASLYLWAWKRENY